MVSGLALWAGGKAMRVRKEASELVEAATAPIAMPILASDFNRIGEGAIPGSHQFLVDIFGNGAPQGSAGRRLSIADLRRISGNRRFPRGYNFPGLAGRGRQR